MKLYYAPGACSLSPHIVAREAGIPIELEKVNLADHKTETGQDYMAVNPKGYVPALRFDDGSILTEGPAIVQYLADQKPASGLAPAAGTLERYRLQEWLTVIALEKQASDYLSLAPPSLSFLGCPLLVLWEALLHKDLSKQCVFYPHSAMPQDDNSRVSPDASSDSTPPLGEIVPWLAAGT